MKHHNSCALHMSFMKFLIVKFLVVKFIMLVYKNILAQVNALSLNTPITGNQTETDRQAHTHAHTHT